MIAIQGRSEQVNPMSFHEISDPEDSSQGEDHPRPPTLGRSSGPIRRVVALDYRSHGERPDFEHDLHDRNYVVPGFILLFFSNLDPIEVANRFFHDHCDRERLATQHAYADDLAQWWTYLARIAKSWNKVDLQDIKAYRNVLVAHISPRTMRKLSHSTLSRRIGTVEVFYRWAFTAGLLKRPVVLFIPEPGGTGPIRWQQNPKGGPGRSVKVPKIPKDENVDPFTDEELAEFLSEMGPDPFDPNLPEHASVRNRLVAELALYTGMRVSEVCGLTKNQFESLAAFLDPRHPLKAAELLLTRGVKGGGTRKVLVRWDEWNAIKRYVGGERKRVSLAAREGAAKRNEKYEEPIDLFLNGLGANGRDIGHALKPETVIRFMRTVAEACGQLRPLAVFEIDPVTGRAAIDPRTKATVSRTRMVPRHTFHDLRHTFACNYYRSEVDEGRPPPLNKLQRLLGHTRLSTTTDIYLKHCETRAAVLEDAYARRLRTRPHARDDR